MSFYSGPWSGEECIDPSGEYVIHADHNLDHKQESHAPCHDDLNVSPVAEEKVKKDWTMAV